MHTTTITATKQEYSRRHHILGEPVYKSVFLEVNGIGEHVYQELKTIAEECNAEVPIHGLAGKLNLTQETRNNCSMEVEFCHYNYRLCP